MSRADKLLARMEQNPRGWRYEQVAGVLAAHGFGLQSKAGSHRTWSHKSGARVTLVEKGSGTLKPYQLTQAIEAIHRSREAE